MKSELNLSKIKDKFKQQNDSNYERIDDKMVFIFIIKLFY